ncbi:S-adenosyl-L-methionine-dependent methyltransferase [Athelia psychrophila]|uniref:S-adenosyl-L-methionine-dependent methyltransferase n=1 Tax=Athelia psychrophila TaxID=1759441 RepID=A0A166S3C8_9AGAM|nr:S-adenosyl-L-methionine-dependent methyltransferase [Fibularhizoctonia sp. CBS 109695]
MGTYRSEASSRTSVDMSERSPSPARSVVSVTGSLRAQAIREEHGRGVNNYSDVYLLPADDDEVNRLNKQHILMTKIMGKYPPPMLEVMRQDDHGETKAILDLGCGGGNWIMDAAHDFPEASCVAVDLVPMQILEMPPNCRSEVDDINLGLEHFYGDFNVVHMRLINTGIKDYAGLIVHISRILRAGGLIDMLEFGYKIFDDKRQVVLPSEAPGSPWLPRWFDKIHIAVGRRGGCLDSASQMYGWVKEIPAFKDVTYRGFWTPTSPWLKGHDSETRRQNDLGWLMRDDIKEFLKSGRPLLLASGLSAAYVDELEDGCRKELDEAKTPHYMVLEQVYARRR